MKVSAHNRGIAAVLGLRAFSSLQNPAYRIFFLGMLGQFASMNINGITGSLLIFRLTDSPALLGTMSLVNAIPMIVISMFGGAVADRVQKKQVIVLGLLFSALLSLGIGLALTTGVISRENPNSWWLLLVSSFLSGTAFGMMLPARQAMIPEIVSREQAMNAVALNWMGMNVLSLVAPAAAGFIIDAINFEAVYYVMAALNLYAAIMMLLVPHTSPVTNQAGNIIEDIRKGFEYVRRDTIIFFVLGFTMIIVVLSMPYQQLLPIYVDKILNVGARGQGVLMSISGIGALVGSVVMAMLPNKKRGIMLLIGGLVSGMALTGFAFSKVWGLSLVFMAFVGLGSTIRGTIGSALLQTYTQSEYMGRVMSIMMMQWGVMGLCTFLAGLLAEVIPVQWVLGGFALTLIVLSLLAFMIVPMVRKLD